MQSTDVLYISLVFFFILTFTRSSFVTLNGEGYQNVVIQIHPNVPYDTDFLRKLQEVVFEGSKSLCSATNNKAYFGNVTIVIPYDWVGEGENVDDMTWPRSYQADVVVTEEHPVFGAKPFTLQYGSCGMGGLPIRIPFGFFNETDNSKRGIQLVHEWFHYRYGVYDENGIAGDHLFPSKYEIFDSQQLLSSYRPTDCTNIPVNGTWIDDEWNFDPGTEATSSLMYSTELPKIQLPCTDENHVKVSPNKHNFHCYEQSVSKVVFQHSDFIGNNQSKMCISPWFNIVVDPFRGYHFIVDVSASNSPNDLESVRFALSHFIFFLPEGIKVSIDKFSSGVVQVQAPIILNTTARNIVLDAINSLQLDNQSTDGLGQALNRAVKNHEEGQEIVLITASSSPSTDFDQILQTFRDRLIAVHVISIGWQTFETLFDLARYGRHYIVPSNFDDVDNSRTSRTWMVDTFYSIDSQARKYRAKVAEWNVDFQEGWNNGSFYIDTNANGLLFCFYSLQSYSWGFAQGNLFGPSGTSCFITRPQKLDAYRAVCNGPIESGQWRYSIKILLSPRSSSAVHFDVWLESDNFPVLSTWTSAQHQQLVDWKSSLLVIYAQIHQQRRPVSNVQLVARLIANGTDFVEIPLDETNFADVTSGDGIYSGPVLSLPPDLTWWTYVIEVRNQSGIIDAGTYNRHPSSGSSIPVSDPVTLGPFSRYAYGHSIRLTESYDTNGIVSKPGRIRDLQIASFADYQVNLTWTAPKANYGTSSDSVFKFKITGEADTEEVLFQGQINPSPGTTDVIEKSLNLPSGIDGLYYLRVYGIDGIEGPASNVLAIRIEPSGGPSDPDVDSAELFWILIGVASGLALISLIVVVVFLIRERPKCCCKGKTSAAAAWVEHGDEKDKKKVDPPAKIEPEEDSRVPPFIRRNSVTRPDPRQVDVNVEINSEFSGSSYSSGFTDQGSSSGSVGAADLGYLEESSATWRYVVPVNETDDVAVVPERRAAPPKRMPDFNRTSPPNSTLNSRSDFREPVPDHIPTPPPSSTWNSRSGLPDRVIRTSPHHSTLNSQSSAHDRIYDVPNSALLPPRRPAGKLSSRPTSPPPRPPSYGSASRTSSPAYLASQVEVLDDEDGHPRPGPLKKTPAQDFLTLIAQDIMESVV